MARVEKGNNLNSAILQPGWTIENDGFGLITCSAVYKVDHGTSSGLPGSGVQALKKAPARGDLFERDSRLQCHRSSSSMDANGIQTISADFVGIATGTTTSPQVSARFSSNQEPITTNSNWANIGGTADDPKNGAEFNLDGSFKRFADPGYEDFYGVTSYLSCGFGITGHFYTSNPSLMIGLKDKVGETSSSGSWYGVNLLGELSVLSASWIGPTENDQLLLTGLGIEFYGKIYKINYDIMFSKDGWNKFIYGGRSSIGTGKKSGKWSGKGTLGLGAAFNARGAAGSLFGT